tara:strand:+ start:670 stop:1047 length:378 start_codon:yes stop_codon:yes gene_type:complete
MSTLKVATIQDTSGNNSSTPAGIASGTAKAWVNFNGTGTVAIRASYNVASLTDNGTGDYTITFTAAMSDANYICTGTSGLSNTANQSICPNFDVAAPTTSAMRIQTTNSANVQDRPYNHVAVFGD